MPLTLSFEMQYCSGTECLCEFVLDQRFLDRDRWAEGSLCCCYNSRNPPMRGIILQVPERVKKAHRSIHISCYSSAEHGLVDIMEP